MTARNDGEVQGRRGHRAVRGWLAVFLLVVTAALVPSGRALAVDQAMESNSILAAESFVGAQMTTPEDGRLRGYGFAATVTSTGTAEGATRLLSTFRPASGQRLVAFALRFDLLRDDSDTSHPVRATLVVDGRRSALDDGDFVSSGELMYAASVPSAAEHVDLEMSAAGLAQAFSLTQGRRVGDQPIVLYRDPAGPDVVTDVNDERTLSAASAADGAKGAVAVALKGARLSYFSPGEPITTADSPSRAFLIVEGTGDGVQPPYGSADWGRYFSSFVALPGGAIKARLADGTVIDARHAGTDEGLLGGSYYFSVPADLTGASITVSPGTVDGSHYRGFVGEPARITIDGEVSFDVGFGAPGSPPDSPTTKALKSSTRPAGQRREVPVAQQGGSRPLSPVLGAIAVALLVAGLIVVGRKRTTGKDQVGDENRTSTCTVEEEVAREPQAELPEPERLIDVMGAAVSLDGPGAAGAARAAIVDALAADNDPPAVVVMAKGPAARLLPLVSSHPALRLVGSADEVVRELDVAQLRRQRSAMEAEEASEESPIRWADVLVVSPGPLERSIRVGLDQLHDPATGRLTAAVICLGRDAFPLAIVDASGGLSTKGEEGGSRRVSVMSEAESATAISRLASSFPPRSDDGVGEPVVEVEGRPTIPAISVQTLGAYRITTQDGEVAKGLRAKARELLAFLAVNREGVTMDAAIEALWPESDPGKGQSYFRTVLANLRTTLRAGAGLDDAVAVIERIGPRYHLDTKFVALDLWQFTDGMADLNIDAADAVREKVADSYGGEFVAGEDFPWAAPIREHLRRKAIDNLTALAELRRAAGNLDGALLATEWAIKFDPYGEELYRVVIHLQLSLGRRDAASRTLRLLEHRLADLDLRPQEATRRMLSHDAS